MENWKTKIIFIAFLVIGAIITFRLADFQIRNHEHHKALAYGQQKKFYSVFGERGEVFFKGGQILATNINSKNAVAATEEIENREEASEALSAILEIEKEEASEKIKKASLISELKKNLSDEEEKALEEAAIPGIHIHEERKRFYPQGMMASQVIGFLGGEKSGQYGVEGYYDDVLKGKEVLREGGFWETEKELLKGGSLFLTIDYNIQFMAERLLKEAEENLKIEGGTIIVMNPKTGALLAMANLPGFDPNYYSKEEDISIFRNSATQKLFEPGSVSKAVTMAGAINEGKVTPETEYFDSGEVRVGEYTLKNYTGRAFGKVNMNEVLENSINTGAVFAGRALGNNLLSSYLEKFGYFEPTGIDLQGESFSRNEAFKKGYEVNFATASFGQGINITPVQLVRAFSAFTNEGKMVSPYIVERTLKDGEVIRSEPSFSERIISENTASQITTMLVNVVEGSFSKRAKIPGYHIAGKTGTSQVPWAVLGVNKKGYSDKTWQSFIGYGPAFDPEFLILVKLDNPMAKTAEYSALPIFRDLAKYVIDYLQIPPDYET